MSQDLAQALQNPAIVLQSGPRPSTRNSTRKASGLMQLGAAVMLGAALLSPINALASTQPDPGQGWQQTTEMVSQQDQGLQVMTVQQLAALQASGQKPDWFGIEVEGRNWHNADVPVDTVYHTPTWIMYGEIMTQDQAMAAGLSTVAPAPIEIGDGAAVERDPQAASGSYEQHMAQFRARQEQQAIAARRDAPSFKMGRNEYNVYERIDLGGKDFKDAAPAQQQAFVARLVKDAYIEMRAGHTIQKPSQRLVDICQHVEDIAAVGGVSSVPEPGSAVFAACQSEQMQSNMLSNSVKRGVAFAGVAIVALLAKAASLAAFFVAGRNFLGMGAKKEEDAEEGLAARLAARRALDGPDPEQPGVARTSSPFRP